MTRMIIRIWRISPGLRITNQEENVTDTVSDSTKIARRRITNQPENETGVLKDIYRWPRKRRNAELTHCPRKRFGASTFVLEYTTQLLPECGLMRCDIIDRHRIGLAWIQDWCRNECLEILSKIKLRVPKEFNDLCFGRRFAWRSNIRKWSQRLS